MKTEILKRVNEQNKKENGSYLTFEMDYDIRENQYIIEVFDYETDEIVNTHTRSTNKSKMAQMSSVVDQYTLKGYRVWDEHFKF